VTQQNRVVLSVPYQEKDSAKALGARWDNTTKCWWIPTALDSRPFSRWLAGHALHQELAPLNKEKFDEYRGIGTPEVVFVPWNCWKCKQTTRAFHGAINRSICITHLFYQPHVIEELEKIRKEMGLEPFGCIKPRFSRTVGHPYVSQGCKHCDALIGENPLLEDFNEVFCSVDMSTYPYCRKISWTLLIPSTSPAEIGQSGRASVVS
jgi:hypothetical protein